MWRRQIFTGSEPLRGCIDASAKAARRLGSANGCGCDRRAACNPYGKRPSKMAPFSDDPADEDVERDLFARPATLSDVGRRNQKDAGQPPHFVPAREVVEDNGGTDRTCTNRICRITSLSPFLGVWELTLRSALRRALEPPALDRPMPIARRRAPQTSGSRFIAARPRSAPSSPGSDTSRSSRGGASPRRPLPWRSAAR